MRKMFCKFSRLYRLYCLFVQSYIKMLKWQLSGLYFFSENLLVLLAEPPWSCPADGRKTAVRVVAVWQIIRTFVRKR